MIINFHKNYISIDLLKLQRNNSPLPTLDYDLYKLNILLINQTKETTTFVINSSIQ